MTEQERNDVVIAALLGSVRDMRRLRRQWFAGDFKSGGDRAAVLRSAKAVEKRVDQLLAELDGAPAAQRDLGF